MTLAEFERLVRRMARDVPPEYLEGVLEVTVSPRTLPHPVRAEIYTLGECIPVTGGEGAEGGEAIQSRVVLYHGSFAALARQDAAFDWTAQAWETLTHELRHHLEWRAERPDLEDFDRAAEQNFARQDGEPFDPLFHLDGDSPAAGVYQVDDDWFLDQVVRAAPARVAFLWHGRRYEVPWPEGATLPLFLTVEGVAEPPPGELVVVLRRKPSVLDLFREVTVTQRNARAVPAGADGGA